MQQLLSGTIKHAPGKAFPSRYDGKPAQRSVTIESNNQSYDCWFDVGSDLEFLHKNDPVLFTVKANGGGKLKAEIAVTDELTAALQHRRAAAPPSVAPQPQQTGTVPTPPPQNRWSQAHRQHLAAEIEQRAAILAHCQKLMSQRLPDLNDLAIAHLAGTLYNDVKTLF